MDTYEVEVVEHSPRCPCSKEYDHRCLCGERKSLHENGTGYVRILGARCRSFKMDMNVECICQLAPKPDWSAINEAEARDRMAKENG